MTDADWSALQTLLPKITNNRVEELIDGTSASQFERFLSTRSFPGGIEEATKAFEMYNLAASAEKGIIIGHGFDPIAQSFDGWQAFRILERDWTKAINMAWIDGAVDSGKPVFLSTPFANIRRGSVTWEELQRVISREGKIVGSK